MERELLWGNRGFAQLAFRDIHRGISWGGTLSIYSLAFSWRLDSVSRVVAGKYMATPHGVFSLRSFFANGVPTTRGDVVAVGQVCERIRTLSCAAGSGRAISDERIAAQLCMEGFVIARRTVAKYRRKLGLSSRGPAAGRSAAMRVGAPA